MNNTDDKSKSITHEAAQPKKVPKHVYPESALSEKQLAELHKIIRPPAEQDAAQTDNKQKATAASTELKIKDKSVVKAVFLVIFMVLFLAAAGFGGWYYWWTTHTTFEYTLQPVVILDGQSVAPGDFLDPEDDLAGISAVFQDPGFVPVAGMQFVPLTLSKDIRTTDTAEVLYVLTPIEYIEHEFTEEGSVLNPVRLLANADITANVSFNVHFTEEPLPLEEYPVGEFPLHLAFNNVPFQVMLHVVDTTPPTATPVNKTIKIGEEVFPEDFVIDVFDASSVSSISFHEEPDVFARNDVTVYVKIEDTFGNSEIFVSELIIQLNETPPVIEGTETIDSEVNTPVSYFPGVTAHDDFGRELEVQVDDSGVDESTEGTYTAVYWVEDFTGLRTEVEVTVHIIDVDPEYVLERIDTILDGIIKDGMTQAEKALAIHDWVRRNNSKSTTGSGSLSTIAEANRALRDRRGDSHVYSSISSLLLTRAGIPNIRIERISSAATEHHWLLINPDERGWHHFDPFPTGHVLGALTSLFTDSQARDLSRRILSHSRIDDYYTYDKELYPDIVQE